MVLVRWRVVAALAVAALVLGGGAAFGAGKQEKGEPPPGPEMITLQAGFRVTGPAYVGTGADRVRMVILLLPVDDKLKGGLPPLPDKRLIYAGFNLDIHGERGSEILELGSSLVKTVVKLEIWSEPQEKAPAVYVLIDGAWKEMSEFASKTTPNKDHVTYEITAWPKDDVMVCLDG